MEIHVFKKIESGDMQSVVTGEKFKATVATITFDFSKVDPDEEATLMDNCHYHLNNFEAEMRKLKKD